jgi:hypothetical protein
VEGMGDLRVKKSKGLYCYAVTSCSARKACSSWSTILL